MSERFYIVGYDSFSHEQFPVKENMTLENAKAYASSHAGQMTIMYVRSQR